MLFSVLIPYIRALLVLALLMLALESCADKPTTPEFIETTISGVVLDAETGKPLAGVRITSEPSTDNVLTNQDGAYTLSANVTVGQSYRIRATKDGYVSDAATVAVEEGQNRLADFSLTPIKPALSVSSDTLRFDANSQSKAIVLSNGGTGELSWSATVPSENWISVTPLSGKVTEQATSLTVNIDRSKIDENGTYTTDVVVTSNGGSQSLHIIVEVTGKDGTPILQVSEVALGFGQQATRSSLSLSNEGTGTLQWTTSANKSWISVTPSEGSGNGQIEVVIDRTQLSPGEYVGSIDITSNGGNKNIPITVSVAAPVIALNWREYDFRSEESATQLSISNLGSGNLSWNIEGIPAWLALSSTEGSVGQEAQSITLAIDRSSIPAGSYRATLSLSSNSVTEPAIEILIKATVLALPVLTVETDTLRFGTMGYVKTLEIANVGNEALTWTLASNVEWLSLDKVSGSIDSGDLETVRLTATPDGLPAGDYIGRLSLSSNDSDASIAVVLSVAQAPALSIQPSRINLGSDQSDIVLKIGNDGTGSLEWSATITADWLAINGNSTGITLDEVDTLLVNVDRNSLPPGDYSTDILVTADDQSLRIPISLTVLPTSKLNITTSINDLGYSLDSLVVYLRNEGNTSLNIAVDLSSPSPAWRVATPAIELQPTESDTFSVYFDRTDLEFGQYETELTIDSGTETTFVPITGSVGRISLTASPGELALSDLSSTQEIELTNDGDLPLDWSLDYAPAWFEIAPTSGQINPSQKQSLSAQLVTGEMEAGIYQDSLVFTYGPYTLSLPLSLTVTPTPSLTFSPESIEFGTEIDDVELEIQNTGNLLLEGTVSLQDEWLVANLDTFSLAIGERLSIGLTAQRDSLSIGDHATLLQITSGMLLETVDVTITRSGALLELSTDRLVFDAFTREIRVGFLNTGNLPLQWQLSDLPDWLTASAISGTANYTEVTFRADDTGFSEGTYYDTITIISNSLIERNISIEINAALNSNSSGNDSSILDGFEVLSPVRVYCSSDSRILPILIRNTTQYQLETNSVRIKYKERNEEFEPEQIFETWGRPIQTDPQRGYNDDWDFNWVRSPLVPASDCLSLTEGYHDIQVVGFHDGQEKTIDARIEWDLLPYSTPIWRPDPPQFRVTELDTVYLKGTYDNRNDSALPNTSGLKSNWFFSHYVDVLSDGLTPLILARYPGNTVISAFVEVWESKDPNRTYGLWSGTNRSAELLNNTVENEITILVNQRETGSINIDIEWPDDPQEPSGGN